MIRQTRRYTRPSRVRDLVGVLMLILTATLLWSESREQMAGGGAAEQVEVWVDVGAQPAAPVIFSSWGSDPELSRPDTDPDSDSLT